MRGITLLSPWQRPLTPTLSPQTGRGRRRSATPRAAGDRPSLGRSLQSAVGRVLPAIEATLARLAAGPQAPREMEQAARALAP